MRIAGSVITLICGIVIVVGLFLPWGVAFPFIGEGDGWWMRNINEVGLVPPLLVLAGGIGTIVLALPAFIVSLATRGARAAVLSLGVLASVTASVAIVGAVWFLAVAWLEPRFTAISYGSYVCAAAAVLGMIFATVTAAVSGVRVVKVVEVREVPAAAAAPPAEPVEAAPAVEAAPVAEPVAEEIVEAAPAAEAAPVAEEDELAPAVEEVAEEPAVEEVEEEPVAEADELAPAVEEDELAPAPPPPPPAAKPKPPAKAKKPAKAAAAGKPEGVKEEDLPLVQQPWETTAEFRARKKRAGR